MNEDGRDLVEKLHREAAQPHHEQKQKIRQLVEAMFRAALERERQQQQHEQALIDSLPGEAGEDSRRDPPLPPGPPRGVHYTELLEVQPGQALAEEWNTYRREVGRLLAEGQDGRHVLIKGGEIVGIFDTFDAAHEAGLQRYLREPFFVHPIRAEEPCLRLAGINCPWPSSRSL
jgi:hypothetical protein